MNKSYEVCNTCPVESICSPYLQPEDPDGRLPVNSDICIGNVCREGQMAATIILNGRPKFTSYKVIFHNGDVHEISGIRFGAREKQDCWFTDRQGNIYVRQRGNAYSTNQKALTR